MILTFGDSICWGQGLKEEHKFDFLLAVVGAFSAAAAGGRGVGVAGADLRDVLWGCGAYSRVDSVCACLGWPPQREGSSEDRGCARGSFVGCDLRVLPGLCATSMWYCGALER